MLNSDGSGFFKANFVISSGGDVWEVLGLALIDNHNLELFRIAQFDSAPTVGPGVQDGPGAYVYFPAYMYPYVNAITMYNHC